MTKSKDSSLIASVVRAYMRELEKAKLGCVEAFHEVEGENKAPSSHLCSQEKEGIKRPQKGEKARRFENFEAAFSTKTLGHFRNIWVTLDSHADTA